MSTSLIPTTTADMMTVATNLAKSGFFQDAKEATQAFAKILAGAELGIPPFAAMSGIYIVKGKPQLGGVLLGGLVKRSGKYDYRVVEQNGTKCSIDFYQGAEKIGNSTFTLEQAKKAGTQNLDKFPENMLYARAMSNGVKWYCPDVTNGPVYVEGELDTPEIQEATAVVVTEPTTEPAQLAKPVATKPVTPPTSEQIQALTDWQNGIDTLTADADAYTKHLADLRALKGISAAEKVKLFDSFKGIAWDKGFDYNDDTKVFYAAEPTPLAETLE